ncbi:hypothetical protein CN195_34030, partial [Sinorhizobium meliloti]
NGSRQRHSSPSSLASGSSTDETGPPHRIPDSPADQRTVRYHRWWHHCVTTQRNPASTIASPDWFRTGVSPDAELKPRTLAIC